MDRTSRRMPGGRLSRSRSAELVLIPNVGHNPHEEVPEIVNAELIRFLSSDPDEPASEDW